MTMNWQDHRFVFVGGLHRSGTTLLARCLAEHPEVSGFSGTRAPEELFAIIPPMVARELVATSGPKQNRWGLRN